MSHAKRMLLILSLVLSAAVVTACADSTAPTDTGMHANTLCEQQGSATRC